MFLNLHKKCNLVVGVNSAVKDVKDKIVHPNIEDHLVLHRLQDSQLLTTYRN